MERERSKLLLLDYPAPGENLNITLAVDNWQEWEIALSRDGFSDTFLETSFPFHLTGFAKDAVKQLFDQYGVGAKATVRLIPYDDNLSPPFDTASQVDYDLDFLSYKESDLNVEINVRTKDLRALIKEQESTNYDMEVFRLKESRPFIYKRLLLDNTVPLHIQDLFSYNRNYMAWTGYWGEPDIDNVSHNGRMTNGRTWTMNVEVREADAPVKDWLMVQSVAGGLIINDTSTDRDAIWCIKMLRGGVISIKSKPTIYCPIITCQILAASSSDFISAVNNVSTGGTFFDIMIAKIPKGKDDTLAGNLLAGFSIPMLADYGNVTAGSPAHSVVLRPGSSTQFFMYGNSQWKRAGAGSPPLNDYPDITVEAGDRIGIFCSLNMPSKLDPYVSAYSGYLVNHIGMCCIDDLTLTYKAANDPTSLDWIDPKKVLQALVDTITKTVGRYTTNIEFEEGEFGYGDRNRYAIIASETLKKYPNAKLHTSYKDFRAWLFTLGYIECETLTGISYRRVSQDTVFNPDPNLANALQLNEVADLKIYPTQKILYSNIKTGYKEIKENTSNNAYEYNGMCEYEVIGSSGKQTLDITTNYRTDSLGMELLIPNRATEYSKDNRDDKSVWVVEIESDNIDDSGRTINYTERKTDTCLPSDTSLTDISGRGWFNGKFSPYNLAMRWSGVLQGFGTALRLASSTNLVDTCIENHILNRMIPISGGGLHPVTYDFATGNDFDLAAIHKNGRNRLIRFSYGGEDYYGYIEDIRRNPLWNTEAQWKLAKFSTNFVETTRQLHVVENVVVTYAENVVTFRIFANGYATDFGDIDLNISYPNWVTEISRVFGDGYIDVKIRIAAQPTNGAARNDFIVVTDNLNTISLTFDVSQEEWRAFTSANITCVPQEVIIPHGGEIANKTVLMMYFSELRALPRTDPLDLMVLEPTTLLWMPSDMLIMAASLDTETEPGKVLVRLFYLGRVSSALVTQPVTDTVVVFQAYSPGSGSISNYTLPIHLIN